LTKESDDFLTKESDDFLPKKVKQNKRDLILMF
jgi:hypothetical protein